MVSLVIFLEWKIAFSELAVLRFHLSYFLCVSSMAVGTSGSLFSAEMGLKILGQIASPFINTLLVPRPNKANEMG